MEARDPGYSQDGQGRVVRRESQHHSSHFSSTERPPATTGRENAAPPIYEQLQREIRSRREEKGAATPTRRRTVKEDSGGLQSRVFGRLPAPSATPPQPPSHRRPKNCSLGGPSVCEIRMPQKKVMQSILLLGKILPFRAHI